MVAVQNRALGGFARTLWARSLASTGPAASTGRLAPDQIRLAKPDITIAPAPNPRELPRFRPRSLDRGLFSPTDSAEDPSFTGSHSNSIPLEYTGGGRHRLDLRPSVWSSWATWPVGAVTG